MKSANPFDRLRRWSTAWQGDDLVVSRNAVEVDRLSANSIQRVVFVQSVRSEPCEMDGDLAFALVETRCDFVVFPADTGIAARVHFERQAYWSAKACVYWSDMLTATLPPQCLERRAFAFSRRAPCYRHIAHETMRARLVNWLIVGPESWEMRRWQQRERARPFARVDTHASAYGALCLPASGDSAH